MVSNETGAVKARTEKGKTTASRVTAPFSPSPYSLHRYNSNFHLALPEGSLPGESDDPLSPVVRNRGGSH